METENESKLSDSYYEVNWQCAHWYFRDFISGFIVIVCIDIFSLLSEQDLVFAFEQLYEFEVSKWNILFVLVYMNQNLGVVLLISKG